MSAFQTLSPKKSPNTHKRGIFNLPKKKKKTHEKSIKTELIDPSLCEHGGFMTSDDGIDEKSEEWMKYEEMDLKFKATLVKTQENMQNLETSLGDLGLEKKSKENTGMPQSSPWGPIGGAGSHSSGDTVAAFSKVKGQPKSEWIGFDDHFSITPNLDPNNKLSHLDVTPIPSPNHSPKPPQNSLSVSLEDLSEKGTKEEKLLDFSSDNNKQPPNPIIHDLLGTISETTQETPPKPAAMFSNDLLNLMGDNPTESKQPSSEIGLVSTSIVDDFLGISSSTAQDNPPKDNTMNPGLTSTNITAGIKQDTADLFGLGSVQPQTNNPPPTSGIDDLFGVGASKSSVGGNMSFDPFADFLGTTESNKETCGTSDKNASSVVSDPFIVEPLGQLTTEQQEVSKSTDEFDLSIPEELRSEETGRSQSKTFQPPSPSISRPRPKRNEGNTLKCDNLLSLNTPKSPKASPKHERRKDFLVSIGPKVEDSDEGKTNGLDDFDPRTMTADVFAQPAMHKDDVWGAEQPASTLSLTDQTLDVNLFTSTPPQQTDKVDTSMDALTGGNANVFSSNNPFLGNMDTNDIPFADGTEDDNTMSSSKDVFFCKEEVVDSTETRNTFNPFATITDSHEHLDLTGNIINDFDPFQTIHEDEPRLITNVEKDTISPVVDSAGEGPSVSPPRFNPFDKDAPLSDNYQVIEKPRTESVRTADSSPTPQLSETFSTEDEEFVEELPPLEDFHKPFTASGWNLLLRLPIKKKLTQNRHWKPVFVTLVVQNNIPIIKIYNHENDPEIMQELPLQPAYNLCNMGLQQYDQFGKCHTIKLQYIFYRESIGVKPERLTPTLGDLVRVRDLKGLRDLVHKPKTTMLLDHAPQTSELLKLGSLNYEDIESFTVEVEDALFRLESNREKTLSYTKDEIRGEILEEYVGQVDKLGHIEFYRARVRLFILAFITGMPVCELGINDKRRRGKEVVGRHDIIPIKTEEWIKIESPVFHNSVDLQEYEKTKMIKFTPLDACKYELMRYRVRVRQNRELPLQVRSFIIVQEKHVEMRVETMIPGYFSNSRRAGQVPCEDIQIRFPIPEPWIYMFREERRFGYGSIKAATRKPGKIKGLERITMMAQGILPPSLIEVSTGTAKYEHLFRSVVWRIGRLPERNEGAYKVHLFTLRLDLGPHDVMPDSFEKYVDISYTMPSSTVSKSQVRSISVNTSEPPDKWVTYCAKYNYKVEIEFKDTNDEVEIEKMAYEPISQSQRKMSQEVDPQDAPMRYPDHAAESDSDFSSDDDD